MNLIQDGSFEDVVQTNFFYDNFGTQTNPGNYVGTSFDSYWSVPVNNVDIVYQAPNGNWSAPPADGTKYLDLVGYGSTGAISQTFNTTPGQTYYVKFAYSNNPGSTSSAAGEVTVTGNPALGPTAFQHSFATGSNFNWKYFYGTFVADSTTSTITFTNTLGGGNGGVLLDNVVASAVPEPATWAIMVLGFLGLGFFGYRKRPQVRVA